MIRILKLITYAALLGVLSAITFIAEIGLRSSLSLLVFASIVMGALFYWRLRLAFALSGIGIMLGTGLVDVAHLIEFAGLDIIIFLLGMMIMMGFLEERRFFEAIIERIMALAGGSARKAIVLLMMGAALSAALVDEVTSILFITSTAIHMAARLGISVVPLVMISVFATNIGSSATVVGNPVGVMIALRAGYGFIDFLRWATPIAISALLLCIPLVFLYFRKFITEMDKRMRAQKMGELAATTVTYTGLRIDPAPTLLFLGTIAGLVMHTQIEDLLGLTKNSMLIGVAVISASIALFLEKERARELVERRVDWWTLSFFLFFFASVGTLAYTGFTSLMSDFFLSMGGRDPLLIFLIAGWIIGIMSAFMDNILAVALWIPIISQLGEAGIHIAPLWWIMLFGATMMGNLTIIGSTANIVAVGLIERQRLGHITLRQWMVPGLVVSMPTFTLAYILTYIQIPLMTV